MMGISLSRYPVKLLPDFRNAELLLALLRIDGLKRHYHAVRDTGTAIDCGAQTREGNTVLFAKLGAVVPIETSAPSFVHQMATRAGRLGNFACFRSH